MYLRILKKDLKRKKSMNIILLIFIIIATTFLASSVNNLISVSGAVDYFLEKSNTPDYVVIAYDRGEGEKIDEWLENSKFVNDYEVETTIPILKDDIYINNDGIKSKYEMTSSMTIEAQTKKYMKLLDDNGEAINLKEGEIAFPIAEKNKNNLKLGDKIVIKVGEVTKELTIKSFVKDPVCGSSIMGMKRALISDKDFNVFKASKEVSIQNFYAIESDDVKGLDKEFQSQDLNILFNFDKDLIKSSFLFEMMTSAILLAVSICLIIISFLILRFTIVFTLQDDFKEIGIMKAIGLKNFGIKGIYLIKYFAITLVGTVLGCILSFPFSDILLKQAAQTVLMEPSKGNGIMNIIASIIVVVLVLFFCYMSTRKLNKFSAIDAIRKGSTGERFKKKSAIKLNKQNKIATPVYMAINDIFSNLRRFIVLALTFCIGTILIIIPVNSLNTLNDGKIVKLFGLTYSDVFIDTGNLEEYISSGDKEKYLKDMSDLEKSIEKKGIPINVHGEVMFKIKYYSEDKKERFSFMTVQSQVNEGGDYNTLEGSMPKIENEVAITETAAKKMDAWIGDTIFGLIDGKEKGFIISGIYESMNNMGESVRVSSKLDISFKNIASILSIQGDFEGKEDPDILREKLKEEYPEYTIKDPKEFISNTIGGVIEQIDSLKNFIVLIVVCINALITLLMVKTFITKEKGEIAMLKSIGFRNSAIKLWQVSRISMILVIAIILGVVLSKVLGPLTIGQIFAYMGVHHVELKVIPLEVYVLYPLILLIVTTIIAYIGSRAIKKVDLKEINNME